MFANLRIALQRKNIAIEAYARYLGVTAKTVNNKMSGETEFTLSEVQATMKLLPEYNIDFLFAQGDTA